MIGKVLDYDEVSYVIRFTVPGYIEEGQAYPLNQWDRPNKDDEVYIFQEDDLFGGLYLYHKLGDRDDKIHSMKTDKFEVILDEDKNSLDIKFLDKFKLEIDLNSNKIDIISTKSELTIDVNKINLGDNGNQPAVLFDKYEDRFRQLYLALSTHTHNLSGSPTTPPVGPELVDFTTTFPNTLPEDKSNSVTIMK